MKNRAIIRKVVIKTLSLPLRQVFRIAYGRHKELKNVFLKIDLDNGISGYGEAAVATHVTGETVSQTHQNLRVFSKELVGRPIASYQQCCLKAAEVFQENKCALAAVEMAVLDALTRAEKIPLWNFFGPQSRLLRTDVTIVLGSLKEARDAALKFYHQGFKTFKVKVGKDHDLDFHRILIMRQVAPKTKILIDANQSFTAKSALGFLKQLADHEIHPILIEQPVPKDDWEGLRAVTRESCVPVCADESISSFNDVKKIVRGRYADAVNIKLMKFGFFEAQRMAEFVRKSGLKLMIGAMMESNLSSTAAAHFAAGLGGFDFVDLDTPFFVRGESEQNPHLNSWGVYHLKKVKAGIGILPPLK